MKMKHILSGLSLCLWAGAGSVSAFDLTPDRGYVAQAYLASQWTGSWTFKVFSVGADNWGPVSNCGYAWGTSQFRNGNGVRLGSTVTKTSSVQYDMTSITNGWFTPNTPTGNLSCSQSHISRGWEDTYGAFGPSMPSSSNSPIAFHARVDPHFRYGGDENRTNNEIWVTMNWNSGMGKYVTAENLDIPAGNKTLNSSDSLFYGPYSMNYSNGNINLTGTSAANNRIYTLDGGNRKVGYQARRMRVNLTGGAVSRHVIKGGAVVTAQFLGQNVY